MAAALHQARQRCSMKKFALAAMALVAATSTASGAISASEASRLAAAASVVQALHPTIPDEYWARARCAAVVPELKKAAFIIGGEYGKGVMSCRTEEAWGAPMFMQLAKGSWGFQAGAEQVDVVLLVMNEAGVQKLLMNKVTLGARAVSAPTRNCRPRSCRTRVRRDCSRGSTFRAVCSGPMTIRTKPSTGPAPHLRRFSPGGRFPRLPRQTRFSAPLPEPPRRPRIRRRPPPPDRHRAARPAHRRRRPRARPRRRLPTMTFECGLRPCSSYWIG
ncbi:MAG: hypothetical protein DMF97_21705 [Acidobacteria bacterium]|nr:MAG: hypothetical protein DMF97_21705 [Acidobacteriota bacterium]